MLDALFLIFFFKVFLGEKESSYLREVFWKKYFLTVLTNAYNHFVANHEIPLTRGVTKISKKVGWRSRESFS